MKKLKAVTLSYDDGVEQDKRLVEILNRYSLKATFNINSGHFGRKHVHPAYLFGKMNEFKVDRIPEDEIREVYRGHEIASHSLTHPPLHELSDEEVIYQMSEDVKNLERVTDGKIHGFAYPGASGNHCAGRLVNLISENTGLYYGRTAISSYSFDIPENLMMLNPTVSHRELSVRDKLATKFIELEADKPQIFYIWGHSYELDADEKYWAGFEQFCEMIAGHDDIFYGTNDEVFKYFNLVGEEK